MTLVVINGLGALDHVWNGFRAALPASVQLRVLDLPGHGDRPPVPDYRYAALVADALARSVDLEPFPLLGWSVGGAVAWLLAARHPERVTHLVLLDPAAPHQSRFKDGPTPDPVHPYTYASPIEARAGLAAIDPTVSDEDIRRGYRLNADGRWEPRFDPAIFPTLVIEARERGEAFRDELGAIAAPTLVIRGEHSLLPEQFAEVADAIPGARQETLAATGHFMVRERPDQLARLVIDFVAG